MAIIEIFLGSFALNLMLIFYCFFIAFKVV